jgi:type IV pilus assembly protein PilB
MTDPTTPAPPPAAPPPAAPPGAPPATGPTPLDHIPLFASLTPQVRRELAAWMQKRVANAGEVIFAEGDVADAMYVIEDGAVQVFVTDAAMGLTVDVATLGRGEAFGEMALVTGEPRKASVKCLERTALWVLGRDVFFRLVQAAPQMGIAIAATLARRLDQVNRTQRVAFGTLRGATIPPELRDAVPWNVIQRHKMVPVATAAGIVTLAAVDPQNRVGLDEIKRLLRGVDIKLMAVTEDDFLKFTVAQQSAGMNRVLQAQAAAPKNYAALAKTAVAYLGVDDAEAEKLKQAASSKDVVELLSQLLFEAIDRGASDIHIEPERNTVAIRFRIDGRLVVRAGGEIPLAALPALVSRLKVLAQLDIAERRMPQDGRISLKVNNRPYDLRLATVNTKYGEKVVMRVLDPQALQAHLGSLILADKVATVIRNLFYRPNGLVLVTGPTGSGKSTTLYAALAERRNPELSICTIEDPIEYTMDGITQVQVNEGIHLGFADVMRTFLRQDPNVILVGETRDADTAKLACSAALTGHLVISSFHTNDAVSAIQRLRAMEVENHLVADSLLGVVNQRLVRRICAACRTETDFGPLVRQNLQKAGVVLDANVKLYKGAGCPKCNGEGFKGRTGVYEVLVATPAVKDAIADGEAAHDIRRIAGEGSYVTLARYASFLLNEGLTVPSEILRILPKSEGIAST